MTILVACWISKATDTHWEYVLLFFLCDCNNSHANAPTYYVNMYIACVVNLNEDSGQIHAPAAMKYLM